MVICIIIFHHKNHKKSAFYCCFIYYLVRNMATVEIYTDGSARGNPGPGGYGAILKYGKHEKELSQGYRRTTNNRMELLAVIVALESLTREGLDVDVYSDSKYVVEAVNQKWVFGWVKKNFKGKKNPDLWKRFLKVYPKHHVKFIWIKGHNEHPYNERCDVLATTAADGGGLLIDEAFESGAAAGEGLL
jgi:ribonuclease HI